VTTFCYFLPNGRLFTLATWIFGRPFSTITVLQKNGLGYILGDFLQTQLATLLAAVN
jgi:hypothetical protein